MATKKPVKKLKQGWISPNMFGYIEKSDIESILDEYESMTKKRKKQGLLNANADEQWKQDKKYIGKLIVDGAYLDHNDVKNLWRSFDFIMDNLAENDWDKQRDLIEFLYNWVADETATSTEQVKLYKKIPTNKKAEAYQKKKLILEKKKKQFEKLKKK